MAMHGTVSQFNPAKEGWTTYIECLNHYFIANDVDSEDKKRSILLSACGSSTYKLIRSLVEPGKLDTTPYADIVKLVKKYYDPVPSEIVQRFHFNTRVRAPTESIATFVAALRELSEFCNFGTTLDQMLRDRLVCGVNHEAIQRKLLSEKNLTFEKAYALAQSIETAERDTANLKSKKGDIPQVNYTASGKLFLTGKSRQPSSSTVKNIPTCYRCGGPHLATSCKFRDAECRFCKKKGHIEKVCRTKARQGTAPKNLPAKTHYMEEAHYMEDASPKDDTAYSLFTLRE